MPEEPEIEMEKLHEAVEKELEREGGAFLRNISLTTAVLATLAAIASLLAGATVNKALVMKTEATTLQAQASDQWTFYQAKGIKASLQDASRAAWQAAGKEAPAVFDETKKRYAEEQKEITAKARELEQERDKRNEEAEHLLHRHHGFANAVALFQVAISLGALAALARNKFVWWGSLVSGAAGIFFFALSYLA